MSSREPHSTDIINAARIKVSGVGGLGLVVIAVLVGVELPSIGQAMTIALGLGVLLGIALIAGRRRAGPLPSSGQRPGANTILSIDAPAPTSAPRRQDPPDMDGHILVAMPSPLRPQASRL